MFKKIIATLLALVSVVALSACSDKTEAPTGSGDPSTSFHQVDKDVNDSFDAQEAQGAQKAEQSTSADATETSTTAKGTIPDDAETTALPKPTKKDNGQVKIKDEFFFIGKTINDTFTLYFGEPEDIQNAPSCHYDGNDTIYCYDGFTLYTYAQGDVNKVYLIEIESPDIYTGIGAHVGCDSNLIKAKYGEPASESSSALTYKLDKCIIRFSMRNDRVTLIEYEEK